MQVDNNLKIYSIVKAHKEVENSARARIYKAVPYAATAAIATGLALTQSGKLANKAAAGLGFLALSGTMNGINDAFYKSTDDKKTTIKKQLMTTGAVILGATGAVTIAKKAADTTKIGGFVKKEIGTLAKEINSTKLAKVIDEKVEPFLNAHALEANIANFIGALGIIFTSTLAQMGLAKGLEQDFKQKAQENYQKGKLAQKIKNQDFEA